jgi:glycosyltransferase involved in cell wall biosynthesis
MLKITVITVCFNAKSSIALTIKSVIEQTYQNIEFIIIDGGSNDGTTNIIIKNKAHIDYYTSEPDTGIYNAMNKGIAVSKGDILFFLNADDRFCDERVVEDVVGIFNKDLSLDLVYGNVLLENSTGLTKCRQDSRLDRKLLARRTVCHQSIFARRGELSKYDGFSENYKVISDYEWLLKLVHSKVNSLHVNRDISIWGTEGISNISKWEFERLKCMLPYYTIIEIVFWRIIPHQFPFIFRFYHSILRQIKNVC